MRILLVEDDMTLAALVSERLRAEGWAVEHEPDGRRASERIVEEQPDMVVLDVMLPGMNGLDVCRTVRPRFSGGVLMLTSRGEDLDEVLGLELGADDYLVKPVRPRVLVARLRALERRVRARGGETPGEPTRVALGGLVADSGRREVTLDGTVIELTTMEFDVLWTLLQRVGLVTPRQELYQALFATEYDTLDRTIDMHVSHLRSKLGDDPKQPRFIKTVRGVGYLMVETAG